MEFPYDVPPELIPQLLPHGPLFRFVMNAHIDYDPPRSPEEGHLYTVTSTLAIPQPRPIQSAVEEYDEQYELTGNDLLAAILVDHFPGYPVVPGVILAEIMGQVGSIILRLNGGGILRQIRTELHLPDDTSTYIGMFGEAGLKWPRGIVPGDTITITFVLNTNDIKLNRHAIFEGRATADIKRSNKVTTQMAVTFQAVPAGSK